MSHSHWQSSLPTVHLNPHSPLASSDTPPTCHAPRVASWNQGPSQRSPPPEGSYASAFLVDLIHRPAGQRRSAGCIWMTFCPSSSQPEDLQLPPAQSALGLRLPS